MSLVNIAKRNLVDEAHAQLEKMIRDQTWKEGEKLPSENKLGDQLGVSRVVVREVLQRLRAEKKIVTHQGMGSFVSNPNNFQLFEVDEKTVRLTEKQFKNVMEYRKCFEFFAIEKAAQRATDEDLKRIQQAYEGMEQAVGDAHTFSEEDYRFHYAIVEATHNEMLVKAMTSCRDEIFYCFLQMNKIHDVMPYGLQMHRDILAGLLERDAKKAIAALKGGSEYNAARLRDFYKERKEE